MCQNPVSHIGCLQSKLILLHNFCQTTFNMKSNANSDRTNRFARTFPDSLIEHRGRS